MTTECCPPFNADAWRDKITEFDHKKFIKGKVRTLFYMPVGFGSTMKRLMTQIEGVGASCPDWLCLSDHTSKWNMDVYLAVDRDVPGADMVELTGRYLSRVYEGPFQDTGKWCQDFAEQAKRDHQEIQKQYMWYTTCPKCAKKSGKNYVVVVGELKS